MKSKLTTYVSFLTIVMGTLAIQEVEADCTSLHTSAEKERKECNTAYDTYQSKGKQLGSYGLTKNAPGQKEAYEKWHEHYLVWERYAQQYNTTKCTPKLVAPSTLPHFDYYRN